MLSRGLTRSIYACGKNLLSGGYVSRTPRVLRLDSKHRSAHTTSKVLTTYYTKDHEWISMDNGVGTVGITKYARDQLGDIVFCELPEVGSEFSEGESMAVIESVKAASDLYTPVSGTVVEINDTVVSDPSIISASPTVDGWLVKLKLSETSELDGLMNAEQYDKLIPE